MSDPITLFIEFLRQNGCEPHSLGDIKPDDTARYFKIKDDKKGKRASYQLDVEDGFAFGWLHDHRIGETYNYTEKNSRKFTKEEKQAYKKKAAEREKKKLAEEAARHNDAAIKAKKIYKQSTLSKEHPYLKAKGTDYAVPVNGDLIVIPMYAEDKLWNVQTISESGEKRYLLDARKKGCFYPIANKEDDKSIIVICEGLADGLSIRLATGYIVVVAFDCGNIKPVSEALREKYPESKIIIACDNDQWRFNPRKKPKGINKDDYSGDNLKWKEWRDSGMLENIGVIKGREAAVSVGAHLAVPEFPENDANKRTDWNDYFLENGIEKVKDFFNNIVSVSAEGRASALNPANEVLVDFIPEHSPSTPNRQNNSPFRILGYDQGSYFFLSYSTGQIVSLSPNALATMSNLYQLAPLDYWIDEFDGEDKKASHKKVADFAANALMQAAHEKSVFSNDKIRGVGVWEDEGRHVMHCGDRLNVDGESVDTEYFESKYVYPKNSIKINDREEPLSSKEANELREICRSISWEVPLSGDLLCGWIIVSMVCATLKWRPHIWITGESESGKTTVINDIIKVILSSIGIFVEGGTTEAAIRQTLGHDGRPIIYDEAESETKKDREIMPAIMQLVRRSSSGATVIKGSSGHKAVTFTVRSCFCFAAINPAEMQRADKSRISKLVIKKARFDGAEDFYRKLKKRIAGTITPKYGERLLARTVVNLTTLLKNCETFTEAAAEVLGSRRAADQIGPMIAGAYLTTSSKEITYEKAKEWLNQHDWSLHTAIEEKSDPEQLVSYICSRDIRYTTQGGSNITITIGELLSRHYKRSHLDEPENILRIYGIWPQEDGVLIMNGSPKLVEILKDTPWADYARPLSDLKGAEKMAPRKFASGLSGRSVKVPIETFGL